MRSNKGISRQNRNMLCAKEWGKTYAKHKHIKMLSATLLKWKAKWDHAVRNAEQRNAATTDIDQDIAYDDRIKEENKRQRYGNKEENIHSTLTAAILPVRLHLAQQFISKTIINVCAIQRKKVTFQKISSTGKSFSYILLHSALLAIHNTALNRRKHRIKVTTMREIEERQKGKKGKPPEYHWKKS